MVEKRVKVAYSEQSKAVTCDVTVEYSGEGIPTNEEIKQETEDLFDKAQKYSILKTMEKIKNGK